MFLVNNLALVKPEKATAVENHLMQMARSGHLGGKVKNKQINTFKINLLYSHYTQMTNKHSFRQISEQGLIEILEKLADKTPTVKVSFAEA